MEVDNFNTQGLSDAQVAEARAKFGANRIETKQESSLLKALKELWTEPMFLLLLASGGIYFFSGEVANGVFIVLAIFMVAGISLYQDSKTNKALKALQSLTQPECKVLRNGKISSVKTEDLVIGDCMVVEEGTSVPADGTILSSNDFAVNESVLTGESVAAQKSVEAGNTEVFQGTSVTGGLAMCRVTAIGAGTRLGKIGKSLENIKQEPTPLQKSISKFVTAMAAIGAVVFLTVWGINFYMSHAVLDSLLKALTLAMSILPEEIPVTFTTFMALGAFRLMKTGVIVKQTQTVEALGSATVICTDKTGTITENKMTLARIYTAKEQKTSELEGSFTLSEAEMELISYGMWSSEPIPFDPMELALHEAYGKSGIPDARPDFKMRHEYPLSGRPPMMTHIFENGAGNRIIAAKGAPEAIMAVSGLPASEQKIVTNEMNVMAAEGYRVLAVAKTGWEGSKFPAEQQQFKFDFLGLLAFYDPPKANIEKVFKAFAKAGIKVKILTGDNEATTKAIAEKTGFEGAEKSLTGDRLAELSDAELRKVVLQTNLFTRMYPEAKLRIINALKAEGQIIAMTGDGVNDAPALKAAHIGISMGSKGTETAKEAGSLIITDNDLYKMVEAIALGRRIYANMKKAIRYIISIHIPIILTVLVPLALGWIYPSIFTPVHVILLELIMGPTCSIVFENEPAEKNAMQQKPRPFGTTFFNRRELTGSIVQGLAITAGTLSIYQFAVTQNAPVDEVRAMVFFTLISSNVFLTLVNRSFHYSVLTTTRYKNNLVPLMLAATLLISLLLLYVPVLSKLFRFAPAGAANMAISVAAGAVSVLWYEGVKWYGARK